MPAVDHNVCSRKRRDRGPDIRNLARSLLEEAKVPLEKIRFEDKPSGVASPIWSTASRGFNRPLSRGEELPLQPQSRLRLEARRDNHQAPLFHAFLPQWGLRSNLNTEIYDYYKQFGHTRDYWPSAESETKRFILRDVLEDDASARQEVDKTVTRWVNKGEVARGSFAKVYLWEKQSSDGGPPLRMAVKDSETSRFWQDYHAEGALIRQLNESRCKNVITVFDWLYKPASASHEAFVRTCYEYAEHGDLSDLSLFYRKHQLVLPEAFMWHIFWSMANALCYCRHGTNESNKTRPGWDPIVHGDLKPGNLLLVNPDDATTGLYPTIKLCDFGIAFTMPESNSKVRAWKSTFQYGTRGFWAPEVETANPLRNGPEKFRPVAASRIHGSHSDIYSLGAVIEQLMDLRFNTLKDHPDFDNPHVVDYYSSELRDLVKACMKTRTHSRPAIYDVYQQTCKAMVEWCDAALAEADSVRDGRPFQCQVLWSKADRARFQQNHNFRHAYRKINRAPLLTGKKTIPPPARNIPVPTPLRTRKQLLSTQSAESLDNKFKAAWQAGGLHDSIAEPASSTQSSAFILPGFGPPNPTPSPFAASTQRSPPSPPTPNPFASLNDKVRTAWHAGNLTLTANSRNASLADTGTSQSSAHRVPSFGINTNVQPPFANQVRSSPHSYARTPTILASPPAVSAPTPSILASPPAFSAQTPATPTLRAELVPTATKPGVASNKRRLEHESPEQQSKRKVSRFIEDLPEAPKAPLRRTLRRVGALRRSDKEGSERRVKLEIEEKVE